jgi:hypothetical protein
MPVFTFYLEWKRLYSLRSDCLPEICIPLKVTMQFPTFRAFSVGELVIFDTVEKQLDADMAED